MRKLAVFAALAISAPLVAAAQVAERPAGLGPFERLRTPRFLPAAEATFMKDDDRVMGVSADGVTKGVPRAARRVAPHRVRSAAHAAYSRHLVSAL